MPNLASVAPASSNPFVDTLIRAAKTAITTAVAIVGGTNLVNWTNLSTLKAAGIAAVGAAFTVLLNVVLSWANTP